MNIYPHKYDFVSKMQTLFPTLIPTNVNKLQYVFVPHAYPQNLVRSYRFWGQRGTSQCERLHYC